MISETSVWPYVTVTPVVGDNRAQLASAWATARGLGRGLLLDARSGPFNLTGNTLELGPVSGTQDSMANVVCLNPANGSPTIAYSGSDQNAVKIYGLKHANFLHFNVRTTVDNTTPLWLATHDVYQSMGSVKFTNCLWEAYANGCTGVAIGADTDVGTRDLNALHFDSCSVNFQSGKTGVAGFSNFSGNSLNHLWTNCFVGSSGASGATGWSFLNDTAYGSLGAGGSASTLINCGGSHLGQIVYMATGFVVNVIGGRSEVSGGSGVALFRAGAGSATEAGLNVQGHVSAGNLSGTVLWKADGNTPITIRDCVVEGTLYNGTVANGTTVSAF